MHKRIAFVSALLSTTLFAAQPAFAAEDLREPAGAERYRALFAGAQLRLDLGGGTDRARTPRLELGVGQGVTGRSGFRGAFQLSSGLDLGEARAKPSLYLSGQPIDRLDRRLGVAPGAAIAIGVAALAGAAVAASSGGGGVEERRRSPCPPGVEVCTQ
jgi:hypothetical protein